MKDINNYESLFEGVENAVYENFVNDEKAKKAKRKYLAKEFGKAIGKGLMLLGGIGTATGGAAIFISCDPDSGNKNQTETVIDSVGGVNIYLDGVSATDAANVIDYIKLAYDSWGPGIEQTNWGNRITRINIVPGNTATGTEVLNIGINISPVGVGGLNAFLNGLITYLQMENAIKLAGQLDDSKNTVRLAMGKVIGGKAII